MEQMGAAGGMPGLDDDEGDDEGEGEGEGDAEDASAPAADKGKGKEASVCNKLRTDHRDSQTDNHRTAS